MSPNAISLFSNCGAGDIGFSAAGLRFGVMAELVEDRLDVALRNHPDAVGVPGDLNTTWQRVVDLWRDQSAGQPPDLLAACPPCQGMSTARGRRGSELDLEAPGARDPRNLLVLPIAWIAAELRPTLIVVENVPAFLNRMLRDPNTGGAATAAGILVRLLEGFYDAYPFLADLADFGVPQSRKRCFVTFVRRRSHAARILRRNGKAPYPADTRSPSGMALGDALASFELPTLDASVEKRARSSAHELHFVPVLQPRHYRMVAAVPPGSGASAWENNDCEACGTADIDADAAVCPDCGTPLPRPVTADESGRPRLVRGIRRGSYRRMDPNRPAATITTTSGRIGASRTLHPFENRVLSPLECALLQTIPRTFDWGDALGRRGVCELRAMVGEAVPPTFTKQHGEVLIDLLADPPRVLRAIPQSNRRSASAVARLRRSVRFPAAQLDQPHTVAAAAVV